MRKFINTEEENEIWSESEVRQYYLDLCSNDEWSASHMTFEEWLFNQEQFIELEK